MPYPYEDEEDDQPEFDLRPEPQNQYDLRPEPAGDELHLDPSQYAAPQRQTQQQANGMPPASPGFLDSISSYIPQGVKDVWDWSGKPLMDVTARAGKSISDYLDPTQYGTYDPRRYAYEFPEALGETLSGLSTPRNLALTAATMGSGAAARAGYAGTARALSGVEAGLSAPVMSEGAQQLYSGEHLSDKAMGAANLFFGGMGLRGGVRGARAGVRPMIEPEMSAAEPTYSFDPSSGDIVNKEMVRARQRADDVIHKSPSQIMKEDYLKKMSYEQLEAEAQKNIEKNIQSGGMPSPADIEHFKMVDKELVNRPQYKQKMNAEIGAEFAPKGGEEAYNAARPQEPTPGATEESIYRNTADRLGMAQELPESSVEPIPELAPTKKPFDPSSLRGLKRANEPVNEAPQSHEEATHKTNTGEQAQTHEEATTRRLPSQSDNTPIGKYGRGKTNEINAAQDVENRPASAAEIAATTTNKRFEQYVVYDKAGNKRVLTGPEAEHYAEAGQAEGETYGVETPRGFITKADRGGNVTGKRISKRIRKEGPGFKGQASPESGGGGNVPPPNEPFDLPLNEPPSGGGNPPSGGGGQPPGKWVRSSELQKGIPIAKREAPEFKKPSFLREAANLPKGLMSVDIPFLTSAAFRQGLPEAFTPSWFRAWKKSALSFGSEKVSKAIRADIMRDKYFEPRYELG